MNDVEKYFREVTGKEEIEKVFKEAEKAETVGAAFSKDAGNVLPLFAHASGYGRISLCYEAEKIVTIPCDMDADFEYLTGKLSHLAKSVKRFSMCGLKEYLEWLPELTSENGFDAIVAAYLLNPLKNDYNAEDVAREHLNLLIDEKLQELGFDKYEISNYAKKGYESKHNLVYWRFENYYGIGLGSCGKNNHQIIEHSRSLTKYLNGDFKTTTIEQSKEEMMFDQVMMSLRLVEGLNLEVFKERYQEDALEIYQDAIDKNKKEGRLVIENNFLNATKEGLYLLNDILVDLMK